MATIQAIWGQIAIDNLNGGTAGLAILPGGASELTLTVTTNKYIDSIVNYSLLKWRHPSQNINKLHGLINTTFILVGGPTGGGPGLWPLSPWTPKIRP